jgi:hypothetical protein
MSEPLVLQLSRAQLQAYNRADLDAFCACYHPEVRVLEADGTVRSQGMEAFRARYAGLFADFEAVYAEVDARLLLGAHVVERERWSRRHRLTGEVSSGEVLVRYTERDGTIAVAEFLF